MDLRAELLALLAPTTLGDTFASEYRLVDVSIELGLRMIFEQGGREIVVELDPIAEERRFAARSRFFSFGYRLGDRAAPIDAGSGKRLCERVAERVSLTEGEVLGRLRAIDASETLRVREIRGSRLLERSGSPDERYFTLSPYVGCLIGCRFCYAPSRLDPLRRLSGLPPVAWGSWVDVRVDAAEVLAGELLEVPTLPIKFCPIVSDPYQAVESKYRMTRKCLEVLATAPPRDVMVLTRSASVVEDGALLASIPRAWVGVSLPTVDDDVRRHFEPRGASVGARLDALERLRSAGVRTFAVVQPVFPGSLIELADALARRVESVRIDVLHGSYAADFTPCPQAADPEWQRTAADTLARLLEERGVLLWRGELPPIQGATGVNSSHP